MKCLFYWFSMYASIVIFSSYTSWFSGLTAKPLENFKAVKELMCTAWTSVSCTPINAPWTNANVTNNNHIWESAFDCPTAD